MEGKHETVSGVGEFKLIERLRTILGPTAPEDVITGIGDDTAVFRHDGKSDLLFTCDIQIENVHFRRDWISPYQLGHRAIAVNLSDVAAMGGRPRLALVSIAMPGDFPVSDFDRLLEGMQDEMASFSGTIVGGNLARTIGKLVIDVFMIGEAPRSGAVTRNGARPGDIIYVTGELGGSSAGRALLHRFGDDTPVDLLHLTNGHLMPAPRVREGQEIAQTGAVPAMIDISDGLAADLGHLCDASAVGAELRASDIPIEGGVEEVTRLCGGTALDHALHGGEDYELLFAVRPDALGLIIRLAEDPGARLTEIGKILPKGEGISLVDLAGASAPLETKCWDHFRSNDDPLADAAD